MWIVICQTYLSVKSGIEIKWHGGGGWQTGRRLRGVWAKLYEVWCKIYLIDFYAMTYEMIFFSFPFFLHFLLERQTYTETTQTKYKEWHPLK